MNPKSTYLLGLEASHIVFIGSAPRLAEDVVRSCRLPSRHARENNALLAPNHAQRLGAFLLPTTPHPLGGSAAT